MGARDSKDVRMGWRSGAVRVVLGLLGLSAGLVTPGLAANVVQPTSCDPKTFDATKNATLEVVLDFKDQTSWPSGCVQHAQMNPGGTVTVKIKSVNVKKYRVSIAGEEEKRDDQKLPSALKTILPALETTPPDTAKADSAAAKLATSLGAKLNAALPGTYGEASKSAQVMARVGASKGNPGFEAALADDAALAFDVALGAFDTEAAKLDKLAKVLDKALAVEEAAETYVELGNGQRSALALSPIPLGCVGNDGGASAAACAAGLGGLESEVKRSIEIMKEMLLAIEINRLSNSTTTAYVLDAAKRKFQAAKDLLEKVPAIAKSLAEHQRPESQSSVENALFTVSRSVDFSGDRLVVDAKVESGPKDKATTLYKVQLKVDPTRVAAFSFSSGFIFSGLTDRSYTVRDGRIERRGDEDDLRPGVGVLAHWHPKSWKVAISAGAAGKDSELQYLVGISLVDGWKQRFVFSVGAAVGSVTRLDRVEENQQFSEKEVPSKDVSRVSWFAGVTFRF